MAEIISQGISDSVAYLQAVADPHTPYSITPKSGNYPNFKNVAIERRLANRWMAVHLGSRIFVDGMGITSAVAESEEVTMLRIPNLLMPTRNKRTVGFQMTPNGAIGGTPGNNTPFNHNLPDELMTDAVDIKFDQVYDNAFIVSRIQWRMIGNNLDILSQQTKNIPLATGFGYDGDVLATQIASALAYANANGNSNIIPYDPSNTDKGYLQKIMNSLVSALSNVRGAYHEGVVSYDRKNSVIVMRWSLFNALMTIDNGAIVNSDIGQKILLNGYLDDSGERLLGSGIVGKYAGVYIKAVPDEYWDFAAAELNLTDEQYAQWNKVVAYIANAAGTYGGLSSTYIDTDKAPTVTPAWQIRTDWGWGIKVTRPSSIALVVSTAGNLATDFTNPVTSFDGIASPNNIEMLIAQYQNSGAATPSGLIGVDNTPVTKVTLTIQGTGSAAIKDAIVTVRGENNTYPSIANNKDGTYSFTLPRASTATVTIAADGYQAAQINVTTTDTAAATKALSQTLTAEDE